MIPPVYTTGAVQLLDPPVPFKPPAGFNIAKRNKLLAFVEGGGTIIVTASASGGETPHVDVLNFLVADWSNPVASSSDTCITAQNTFGNSVGLPSSVPCNADSQLSTPILWDVSYGTSQNAAVASYKYGVGHIHFINSDFKHAAEGCAGRNMGAVDVLKHHVGAGNKCCECGGGDEMFTGSDDPSDLHTCYRQGNKFKYNPTAKFTPPSKSAGQTPVCGCGAPPYKKRATIVKHYVSPGVTDTRSLERTIPAAGAKGRPMDLSLKAAQSSPDITGIACENLVCYVTTNRETTMWNVFYDDAERMTAHSMCRKRSTYLGSPAACHKQGLACKGNYCHAILKDGSAAVWGNKDTVADQTPLHRMGLDLKGTTDAKQTVHLACQDRGQVCLVIFRDGSAEAWRHGRSNTNYLDILSDADPRRSPPVELSGHDGPFVKGECSFSYCVAIRQNGAAVVFGTEDAWDMQEMQQYAVRYPFVDHRLSTAGITDVTCAFDMCLLRLANGTSQQLNNKGLFWGNEAGFPVWILPGCDDISMRDMMRPENERYNATCLSLLTSNIVEEACDLYACTRLYADGRASISAVFQGFMGGGTVPKLSHAELSSVKSISCKRFSCLIVYRNQTAVIRGAAVTRQGQVESPNTVTDVVHGKCFAYADLCAAFFTNGTARVWGPPHLLKDDEKFDSIYYTADDLNRDLVNLTDVKDISCGGRSCIALLGDGSVKVWGKHGPGDTAGPPVDLSGAGPAGKVVEISCGSVQCAVVYEDRSARDFGHFVHQGRLATAPPALTGVVGTCAGTANKHPGGDTWHLSELAKILLGVGGGIGVGLLGYTAYIKWGGGKTSDTPPGSVFAPDSVNASLL